MSAITEQQAQDTLAPAAAAEPASVNQAAADAAPAEDTEMDPCAVCRFVDDENPRACLPRACLPCGHLMHPGCIKGWVETLSDQNLARAPGVGPIPVISAASMEDLPAPTCPMCRAPIVFSCGHAARATEFDAGAIAADHWNQLCADCLDDEHGYDEFDEDDDDDGDDDEDDESGVPQSNDSQRTSRACSADY